MASELIRGQILASNRFFWLNAVVAGCVPPGLGGGLPSARAPARPKGALKPRPARPCPALAPQKVP